MTRGSGDAALPRWALGVVLPLIAFYYSQYGYSPLGGSNTFTRAGYVAQYDDGVYRFRVLGREIVLWVYDAFGSLLGRAAGGGPVRTADVVPDFDAGLFAAHAVVNGAGYVAASVLLLSLLTARAGDRGLVLYLALQVLVLASAWMVTPYDFLGYALLLGAIAAFHWDHRWAVIAAPVLVALGTLNRETQALAVAYMLVAVLVSGRRRRDVVVFAVSAAAFLLVYVGLRVVLGGGAGVVQELTFGWQSGQSMVGLAAAAASAALVQIVAEWAVGPAARRPVVFAYAAMSPYLLVVLLSGFYLEYRLYVPMLLVQAVAAVRLRPEEDAGRTEAPTLGRSVRAASVT